ncbi:PASTA domain-containing protein [Mycolicibacterium sp. XJ1819]
MALARTSNDLVGLAVNISHMGKQRWILPIAAGIAVATGCSSAPAPPAETVTVTTERPVTGATAPTVAPSSVPAHSVPDATAAPAAQSWTMPNLIGRNLQDAQDAIQALTENQIFYSGSTDLTGQGRNQILDANWQVCTSTPPPGATITKDTAIDFGVVRIDVEDCP